MDTTRRGLLKLLPALPMATKKMATKKVGDAAAAAILQSSANSAMANKLVSAVALAPQANVVGYDDKLRALDAIGMLPDWFLSDVKTQADHRCRWEIDPEIAVLKSVSVPVKLKMHRDLSRRRYMEEMRSGWLRAAARKAFYSNNE